jgi:hypothetical protein
MLLMLNHTTLRNRTPQLEHGTSQKTPPLPLRDNKTFERLLTTRKTTLKWEPEGCPKAKEIKASIISTKKEKKRKNERKNEWKREEKNKNKKESKEKKLKII